MDIEIIEVFPNIHLGGTDKKVVNFDQLKETGVKGILLIDFL